MTDQELNRAVQYVTASTSYGRDMVADILKTGLGEMTALATESSERFERDVLLEYVCQWTIKRTAQPEPLVREILGCASRWLDEVYEEIAKRQPEALGLSSDDDDDDDDDAEPV
ncbi:MAG: hypothetical protein Q7U76_18630 [Nitrospirota bacterium]|jgi:hypothetical protein|nr:hypothetical protein [Nitrospirota bacterium]